MFSERSALFLPVLNELPEKKLVVFVCIHVTALMMDLVTVRRQRGGLHPMIRIDICLTECQTTMRTP